MFSWLTYIILLDSVLKIFFVSDRLPTSTLMESVTVTSSLRTCYWTLTVVFSSCVTLVAPNIWSEENLMSHTFVLDITGLTIS